MRVTSDPTSARRGLEGQESLAFWTLLKGARASLRDSFPTDRISHSLSCSRSAFFLISPLLLFPPPGTPFPVSLRFAHHGLFFQAFPPKQPQAEAESLRQGSALREF